MVLRKKFLIFVVAMMISGILLSGCSIVKSSKTMGDWTISDIAYDVDSGRGYTVYIKENDQYVPYLVLTANYNGNTLLLRKDLLDEPHKYGYGDYFGESTQENYGNDLGLPASDELANDEGKALKYFKKNSIIAYCNGEPCSYWLRSRDTWDDNLAWGIGPEGTYGGGDTKSLNGVRPAFCVSKTVKISEKDGTYILGE